MKAVVINQYGNKDVLEAADVAVTTPGRGEILVKVHATALNPVDYKIREGHLQEIFSVTFPRILGGDISGVVAAKGEHADDFNVGDEVFFSNPLDQDGGYAEYVKVNQSIVARKPKTLTHIESASLPVVGLTAVQALRDYAGVKRGDKVLIHAGAGGVGSFAIQYAKHLGAKVYTTATADKQEYLKSLGADVVIDYTSADFVEVARRDGGMDVVFETVGGPNYLRSLKAVKAGGAVPSIVNPPDEESIKFAANLNIKTSFMLLSGNRSDLELIAQLVDQRTVRTKIGVVLPLHEVKKGHELLQKGGTSGKIVLDLKD